MEITRIFHADTRAITNVERRYCGQQNDSLSTTLHFEYDPIDFITAGGYVPYIMFAIYDEQGNPQIYGPASTPVFDGHTFPIPWEVTHMVKTQRVEYQLYFVKTTTTPNANGTPKLDDVTTVQSAIDGFALKPSITCKSKCPPCPPMAPSTEPTVVGYINLFKDYGLMLPVEQVEDVENNKLILKFHTYNEKNQDLPLNVPFLVNGKVPTELLHTVSTWEGMVSDYDLPTAKMVHDHIEDTYTPKTMSVAHWNRDTTYQKGSVVVATMDAPTDFAIIYISRVYDNKGHIPMTESSKAFWNRILSSDSIVSAWRAAPNDATVPSEKLVKDSLDLKLDDSQLITAWTSPASLDTNIPSEKLVKGSLDAKMDDSQLITAWASLQPGEMLQVPSARITKDLIDTKMDIGIIQDHWNDPPLDTNIPSEKLVKGSLDEKTDYRMAIRDWVASATYSLASTVIYDGTIFISRSDSNTGHEPLVSPEWWGQVSGSTGDGCKRYSTVIGDGSRRIFAVRHGLDAMNVFVSMRYASGNRMMTEADTYIVDRNTIRLEFYSPPAVSEIVVTMSTGIVGSYECDIGDGVSTSFTVAHGFGTRELFITLMDNSTKKLIKTDTYLISPTQLSLSFTSPPAVKGVHVCVSPNACEFVADKGYVHTQDVPSDTWTAEHNLSRMVEVQAFDEDGNLLDGCIKQDLGTLKSVTIGFNHPHKGYAVMR